MSSTSLTKKQRALMTACAEDYAELGDGVPVTGYFAKHSIRTAKSLENRGFITLREDGAFDTWASFDVDQNADWVEMNGGVDAE